MTQAQLRSNLLLALEEELIDLGFTDLVQCLYPAKDMPRVKEVSKAVDTAYYDLVEALRQVSRIAVRLGYIERNKNVQNS